MRIDDESVDRRYVDFAEMANWPDECIDRVRELRISSRLDAETTNDDARPTTVPALRVGGGPTGDAPVLDILGRCVACP